MPSKSNSSVRSKLHNWTVARIHPDPGVPGPSKPPSAHRCGVPLNLPSPTASRAATPVAKVRWGYQDPELSILGHVHDIFDHLSIAHPLRNVNHCTSGNLLLRLPQSPLAASDSAAPPRDGKTSVRGASVHKSHVIPMCHGRTCSFSILTYFILI